MRPPILLACLVVAAAGCRAEGTAQELLAQTTDLLENELVRVVEVTYPPGAVAPLHTHRYARFAYALEPGVLELISAAGDTARVELTPGQTIWRPAETHVVRNVGERTVKILEAEIKTR